MNLLRNVSIVCITIVFLSFVKTAFSNSAATTSFTMSSTIIADLTAVATRPLDFGQIQQSSTTQVVIVNPTDPTSAQFNISGPAGKIVNYSINGITQLICVSGACLVGADNIPVDTFMFGGGFIGENSMTIPGTSGMGTIVAGGVGAKLHVAAAQPLGVYSNIGTFNINYS